VRRGVATAELIVGLGVIGLSVVVGHQTTEIPVTPLYSRIGPKVFPYIVATGLGLLGAALLIAALRGGWSDEVDAPSDPPDWRALGWLLGGLLFNVVLIKPLGFVLASILLFCCVARAFGSVRLARDAAIGAALAVVVYVGFDRVLGFSIGAGILEGIL
jgi:putative tricarboxylic transport membrane protein